MTTISNVFRVLATLVAVSFATGCMQEHSDEHLESSESELGARGPCSMQTPSCVDVRIVAHEDDDLLFMNPDIARSIASGTKMTVIFLTAGTSVGDDNYVAFMQQREIGILNAYGYMVSPSWSGTSTNDASWIKAHWRLHNGAPRSFTTVDSNGQIVVRQVIQYDFAEALPLGGSLSVVFFRINEEGSLTQMWKDATWKGGTVECDADCLLASVLPRQEYTRADLIDVLKQLIQTAHAAAPSGQLVLSTLDSTRLNVRDGGIEGTDLEGYYVHDFADNPDHTAAARFAITAMAQYSDVASSAPRSLRIYRGYSIGVEGENLSDLPADRPSKRYPFHRYDVFYAPGVFVNPDGSSGVTEYDEWFLRKYASISVASASPLRGRLGVASGGCVLANGTVGSCGSAPEWTVTTTNQLQMGSSCLYVTPSGAVQPAPCAASRAQFFALFSNGQIRTDNARCVQAVGSSLISTECDRQETDAGNPTRKPIPAQNFTLLFSSSTLLYTNSRLGTPQFGDSTEVDDAPSYFRTFTISEGRICLRRTNGVGCATYVDAPGETAPLDGKLNPFSYWATSPAEYTDAQGWQDASTGGTLSFRRLYDGSAPSACGRGYYGIRCGVGSAATWWSSDFSTPGGWGSTPSYYGSIRLANVNGDAYADVCGRGYYGVQCALGNGASFGSTIVMTGEFSNSAGWTDSSTAESIQFGDINADGKDDVCGRGYFGMRCATASISGTAFESQHWWSFNVNPGTRQDNGTPSVIPNTFEFGNGDPTSDWESAPSQYRSIRLVDINRDGFADVCGRSSAGIDCALSTGTAFDAKRTVMPFDFSDAMGWAPEKSGSTLTFGNLDGDARVDVCARTGAGVYCSEGY